MKRLYFLILVSGVTITTSFSQTTNCTQVLRLARTQYEQGRLHEMPALMEGCLAASSGKGFTTAEKTEAYRLLTLAYIYLEEPEKADESMLALLKTDHFFQINQSLDPAEFIALYNKFRHDPIFWGALKIGFGATQPLVSNYYNIGSQAGGKGTYGLKPSIQFFLSFEKDIVKKISLAPEIGYVTRNYSYNNPNLAVADEDPKKSISSQNFLINQSWVDLNVIAHYKFKDTQQFKTYLGLGPGVSYLLSSSNQAGTVLGNGFTVTGSSIDDSKSYNKLCYSVIAVAGLKYKFGDLYVMGEVRYQYGLVNVVDKSNRTNQEVAFDYQGQYNDYKMNNISVAIGVAYPYFKPKKLIK